MQNRVNQEDTTLQPLDRADNHRKLMLIHFHSHKTNVHATSQDE